MTVQELFASLTEEEREEFVELYVQKDGQIFKFMKNSMPVYPKRQWKKLCWIGKAHYIKELLEYESKRRMNQKEYVRIRKLIRATIDRFADTKVEHDPEYIVFAMESEHDAIFGDSFLVKRDDLIAFDGDIKNVDTYAYDLSPHNEILRYDISEMCLSLYIDKVSMAVDIFEEMTFCGFDDAFQEETIDEHKSKIDEALAEIEKGDTQYLSSEEVFKSLGFEDTRTPQQKELSFEMVRIDAQAMLDKRASVFKTEKERLNNIASE